MTLSHLPDSRLPLLYARPAVTPPQLLSDGATVHGKCHITDDDENIAAIFSVVQPVSEWTGSVVVTSPPREVHSIAMSMAVCLFVCSLAYLENHTGELH